MTKKPKTKRQTKPKQVRRVAHRCLRCRKSDFLNYRRTKCDNCGAGPEWIEKVVTYVDPGPS
jgi:hypothetical protein